MTALRDLTELRDLITVGESEPVGKEVVAVALQALRRASLLTPAEFAVRAELSLLQVGLAESGSVLPGRDELHGYLMAAGANDADRRFVFDLWTQVRVREGAGLAVRSPVAHPRPDTSFWPDPATLHRVEDFRMALEAVKNSTGASYATLAKVADDLGYPLPRTTIHNLCKRPRLPASRELVTNFVLICGGRAETADAWGAAWQRLRTAQAVEGDRVLEDCEAVPTKDFGSGVVDQPSSSARVQWWSAGGLWSAVILGLVLFVAGVLVGTVVH